MTFKVRIVHGIHKIYQSIKPRSIFSSCDMVIQEEMELMSVGAMVGKIDCRL